MGGLTRRIGIVAVGRAAGTFSIFAVYAILARTWRPQDLGIYLVLLALVNGLAPIFLLGLPTSLLYFFPRRTAEGRRALVVQAGLLLGTAGLLLCALLLFLGPELARWSEPKAMAGVGDPLTYIIPFLPYVFALVAGGFVESALIAAGRPGWQAWLALLTAGGLVGAAGCGKHLALQVSQVLLLFSAVGAVRLAVGLLLVGMAVGWGAKERWNGLREFVGYSVPIGLNDAVGSLSRTVDRVVILFFFTAGTFADYHLGAFEVPINLLLAAVVSVLVPQISRLYQDGQLEEIGALWRRAVGRLSLLVLPLFCFLFLFAEPLIVTYLTDRYLRARWVFRLFLLALPLRCAIYNPLLVGMGKAKWALWGSLFDLLLNTVLSLLLVRLLLVRSPEWAFLGPAAATVAATYLQVFLLVGMIARHLRWNLRQLLPWGRLLRVAGISCGAALAGWWGTGWIDLPQIRLLTGGGVCGLALILSLWFSRGDREELLATLRGLGRG